MLKVVRNLIPCVCLLFVFSFLFLGVNPASASETIDTSVGIEPSLTLTLPTAALNLALDPSTTTFGYKDLPISVATNNETGYVMTVSTAGNNTDLVNTTDNNIVLETLPTLAGGYTDSTFVVNKWGYKNGLANNYFPFVSGDTVLSNAGPTNGDSTTLRFGTKIDYMQPEGTYSTTFNFALVVNPVIYYMQDFTPNMCATTPTTVVDRRDDQEYIVQRLADGNCWMMTNLNLGAVALNTNIDNTNTNASPSTSITPAAFSAWNRSSSGAAASYTVPKFQTVPGTDSGTQTPYGTLYNFCAASATSICTNNNPSDAVYDLCPKGWRLPTGLSGGEFEGLVVPTYEPLAKARAPITSGGLALAAPGYFYSNASVEQKDVRGFYWASTRYNANEVSQLIVAPTSAYGSKVYTVYDADFSYGRSIRCILKDDRTLSNIREMQQINDQIVANISNGSTAELKDSRDNQKYTVKKINGNLWMTRNLAVGCNGYGDHYGSTITPIEITNANTNISAANYTTTSGSLATSGDDYTNALMECSSEYGAWYNFAAASAGTITGSSNSNNSTSDLCPAGWRLPLNTELQTLGSYQTDFAPVFGGFYWGGTTLQTEAGLWWSATAYSATVHYAMSSGMLMNYNSYNARIAGNYVRCIAK